MFQQASKTLSIRGDAVDMNRASVLLELEGSVGLDGDLDTQLRAEALAALKGSENTPPDLLGHSGRRRETGKQPDMGGTAGAGRTNLA